MAKGMFGFGAMGAMPDEAVAQAKPDPAMRRRQIEAAASQHQVPANVLMALDEVGISDFDTAAQKIAADMKGGRTVDQIVGPDLMNRAYDLADQMYPRAAAPSQPQGASVMRDLPAALGASVAGAAGGIVRGAGEALAGATDAINANIFDPFTEGFTGKPVAESKAENIAEPIANLIGGENGLAGYLDSFVSPEVKQDIADLTDPNADLFDTSTWKAGKNPTVRGAIYSAIDVFGSMAPVVVIGALTRSPAAAAAAGAGMSAGDASKNAEQAIMEMANTVLPDGRSKLEAESSVYNRLIAQGMSKDDALFVTKRKAAQFAAIAAAPLGAFEGAALQNLFSGSISALAKHSTAGRVAGGAAGGALFEGAQETAENMAGAAGMNYGAGTNESITKGSLNNFALGALGGAPMGAIGGAFGAQQDTASDGSARGQEVTPAMGLPGPDAGVTSNEIAPKGPIGRAAALAPDLTPQPEIPAPQPFFPDQKPGSAIKLYDPEGEVTHNAVFLGEGPDGVSVRINGEEIILDPAAFDQARNDAMQMEEEAKAAAKPKKPKGKAKPEAPAPEAEAFLPEERTEPDTAAADALQEMGYNDGPWSEPAPVAPEPIAGGLAQQAASAVNAPVAAKPDTTITPEDALSRAKKIEAIAKESGWNKRLTKQHAEFMAIAQPGVTNDIGKPVLADSAGSNGAVGGSEPVDEGAGQGSEVIAGQQEGNPLDAGSTDVPSIQDGVVHAVASGEPDASLKAQPQEDTDKPLRDHANENLVVDDVLPGRQKQGVPLASVKVGKAPDGSFMVRSDAATSTGGFAKPMGGNFKDADEALNHGAAAIRKHADAVLSPGALERGYNEQDQADARKILKWLGERGKPAAAPRTPVAPMEADPGKRIQPDLLGGQPVTETDMAKKERTRREWGKFLGIAEHGKSSEDMELEGRTAILRPGKIVLRANATSKSDQDRTIDTEGMSRDDISTAVRGALRDLERVAPLPKPVVAEPVAPAPEPVKPAAKAVAPVAAEPAGVADENYQMVRDIQTGKDMAVPAASGARIENIRDKAAVLRGVPKDAPPVVDGISLKWDEKEKGFIFARKHVEKVRAALAKPKPTRTQIGTNADGNPVYEDERGVRSYVESGVRVSEPVRMIPERDGSISTMPGLNRSSEFEPVADSAATSNSVDDTEQPTQAQQTPTAAEVTAAAADADRNPTDAQKYAGNYKMGHISWNGLDISIETAKGAMRSGKDATGKEWSVKLPAHYGYIKRTEGADGDHLDVYMGDKPESNNVFVIDQVDAKTGQFDEHKIMLGFLDANAALAAYVAGFSDMKGADRMGAITRMEAGSLIYNLKNSNWEAPWSRDLIEKLRVNDEPAYGASNTLVTADRAAELRKKLQDKLKNQLNAGIDPEILAMGAELAVFHIEAGARGFIDLAKAIAADLGTTPTKIRPYLRSWYNGARDMMEDGGLSIDGMDDPIAVREAMKNLEAIASPEAAESGMVEDETKGVGRDVAGDAVRKGGSDQLEEPSPGLVSDLQAGGPAGSRGPDGEQGSRAASGNPDGEGLEQAGSGRIGAAGNGVRAAKSNVASPKPRKPKAEANPDTAGPVTPDLPKVKAGKVNVPTTNFTITDSLRLGQGAEKEKFNDNIAAIRTLKLIQRENRRASPDEQNVLARYVGWGGLKNAFRVAGSKDDDGIAKGWEKRARELEELLEPTEYSAARNSTKAAHYTSQTIVQSIWDGVRRLGFRGGAVLEPSMGSGNFLGLMPQDLRGASKVVGVEYDAITAGIAKHLYPAATVLHSGFEKLPMPNGSFGLAIGNPPFGRDQLYFRHSPELNKKSIHNQFFLASMDALAPGGILAMVVSHYLMDALDSTNRLDMAARAKLVHAIRLPSNAFEENARTEVVTDILFFRKHDAADMALAQFIAHNATAEDSALRAAMSKEKDGKARFSRDEISRGMEIKASMAKWVGAETINDPAGSGEQINVNSYFLRNKGRIIGKLDASGTMNGRGGGLNVTLDDPSTFGPALAQAIEDMRSEEPRDEVAERTLSGYEAMAESLVLAARNAEPGAVRVSEDGGLKLVMDVDAGDSAKTMLLEVDLDETTPFNSEYSMTADWKWQTVEDVLDDKGQKIKQAKADGSPSNRNMKRVKVFASTADIPARHKWGAKRIAMLRAMLPVRDLFKRQLMLETQSGTDKQIERNREKLNEAYNAFVKTYGQFTDPKVSAIAMLMPDGPLALGTEMTGKDGVVGKSAIMSARVTFPSIMAESADSVSDAVVISLSERGLIDLERVAQLLGVDVEKASEMLAEGDNPRAFFDPETERWESSDMYLSGMVRRKLYSAREAGLSKNVAALEAVMPEKWDSSKVTPSIGSTWIPAHVYRDFLKHLGYQSSFVSFQEATNLFSGDVSGDPKPAWATTGRAFSPGEIVFRMLNSQPMKVTYTDSNKVTHVDEQASVESQQKAAEIATEFLDWVFQDNDQRNQLVDIFNEKFNTRLIRQRDGSHLTLPGKSPAITLRRHQINAIWRGIVDKAILMDHAVGAGKTFTAIARVMERRRMGLSRKPMIVVPNHIIGQWRDDFLTLYPGANVLAASEEDFKGANRRRLFARIAAGDYDAVVIGHSSFGFIDIDPSTEQRFLEEELRAAMDAVKEADEAAQEAGVQGWGKPFGVAEAERLVTKITTRLERVRAGKKDRLLTFEEMGIDDLTIDESHEYKNLAYSSRLQNVSGMGNKAGSAKATDLHLKVRSLHERPGTSMAFLSGTPISNSVSEMYLILRNLVPNELREMGLENFDAWRSMFVSASTQWEPTESGGLKEVNRLGREWTNMRTLMDLYYSVADAVPIEDVAKNHSADNNGERFPLPPVKSRVEGNGDRDMVAVEPDSQQRRILRDIVAGFAALPGLERKERNAQRLRLMDRARKVSLDARAVDPTIEVPTGTGKIGAVVDNVARLYSKWADEKGTQIIFLDRSVPKAQEDANFIEEYDALAEKLQAAEAAGDDKEVEKLAEKLDKYSPGDVSARRDAVAGGWNAYDEIKRQLVAKGIPDAEIEFVQSANNPAEKKEMFKRVKSGATRVIIGSTPRMGAGTNVQDLLVGLHHVDVTWKPSDIEQREGRIVRQGNILLEKLGADMFAVEVIAYATKMTVDAKMWSLNSTKLKAINGIRKYDGSFAMEFEDEDAASMAEMAAIATGNPLMVERVTLDGDLNKMEMSRRSFNSRMNAMRGELADADKIIATADQRVADAEAFAVVQQKARDEISARSKLRQIDVDGTVYKSDEAARRAVNAEIAKQKAGDENARWKLTINGNPVTNSDTANGELNRIFGTENFEVTVDGRAHVSMARASAAVSDKINKAIADRPFEDSIAVDGITIMGLPAEIDVFPRPYTREANAKRVSFAFLLGKKTEWETEADADKGSFTQQGARAVLDRLFDRMTPDAMKHRATSLRQQKAVAITKKPELEAQLKKTWPLSGEYEQKRERLQSVIKDLEGASDSARLGDDIGEASESRFDLGVVQPVPVSAMRAVSDALAAEVKAAGLEGKVSPALVRRLLGSSGVPIQGRQSGALIEVSAESSDPVGVMRHEIVHALRDADLWTAPYGLFTGAEWKSLVAAARADAGLMARVKKAYSDKSEAVQIEESVAEMYREWATARSFSGSLSRAFSKVASFFRAFASALRGLGFNDAAMVMERIAGGAIGGRGPDGGGRKKAALTNGAKEMRGDLIKAQDKFKGLVGSAHWKDPGALVSNIVTDAMVGGNGYNSLALVPGRALFSELGKYLPAAKAYLRQKEEMDSVRNDWHARADAVAQRWLEARGKNKEANEKLADLMHKSTLSGIDPSRPDTWRHAMDAGARREVSEHGDEARDWAKATMSQIAAHESTYAKLKAEYDALPLEFRQLYRTVRNGYDAMGEAFEKAILKNIDNATKVGLKRAIRAHEKEIARIRDEGLEGDERDEAIASADATLKAIKMRGGFAGKARLAGLRKKFESNRLKGPYFPLARFGDYFVTVRDAQGAVTSFSKFEKEGRQLAFIREMKEQGETNIEFGTMDDAQKLRGQIDPGFVADIENMLAESGAGDEVMDAVWQRWLETLPDRSIRTSNIHRKGRTGYSADAFRAFSKQMFHGGHQLSKLEHGLPMEEHLNDATEQARNADNPNRALQVVAEMKKRHDFTMNPKGNKFVAAMSGLAFIWYLGATPAAAVANLTQTSIVGIPLMSARFSKAGVIGAANALGAASKDFVAGRGKVSKRVAGVPVWTDQWTAENSPNLAPDERAALAEAVRRGTIDKTQAHDLASAAEHGIEYNATREKWMRKIAFFFHHAERFNREITFLASYRLAKAEGLKPDEAIDAAADLTFKIHFDMQNNSRPRVMQNDIGKVLTTFRAFTVNLLWRLFRDTHQALQGATKEDRREARAQLVGITLSMMAHAGIKGVWGYGLLMMLLGMLMPGDDDDIEEWMQEALLMQGDSLGVAAWNFTMGAVLNGAPGQVFGVDLTDRIGMPNLWFREAPNDLEGADLYSHYVMEVMGPAVGVGGGFFRGVQLASDGEVWRGAEAAFPKAVRDAMKSVRYVSDGVNTLNGDSLVDGVSPYQAIVQAIGFTPAEIAERYDMNSRLKDREREVTGERSGIQKTAANAILAGEDIPADVLADISDFNARYPEYPITSDTIRQSARSKARATERSEFGIVLNPKLNDRLRAELATPIGR